MFDSQFPFLFAVLGAFFGWQAQEDVHKEMRELLQLFLELDRACVIRNTQLRLIHCRQDAFPVRCDSRMACVRFALLNEQCATRGALHFQYLRFVAYHE